MNRTQNNSSNGVFYINGGSFIHTFAATGTDGDNTFIGSLAGNFTMAGSGIQASYNLGIGSSVLKSNTTGLKNTAVGTYSMQNNTSGVNNTGIGQATLFSNTTGYNNTVGGVRAAAFGTGHDEAGWGVDALSRGNTGSFNVGVGTDALYNVWNSMYSVAIGDSTLWVDSTAYYNVAVGASAGYGLGGNYATRHDSLATFLGAYATRDNSISGDVALNNITAVGYNAKVSTSNSLVLGGTGTYAVNVGIGTTAPNSILQVNGSFATAYVAKTSTYPITVNDYTINCTSGTFTTTLPTAVGCAGRMYFITNSGAGTITLATTSSQTFANVTATPTTLTLGTLTGVLVQSNGANWLKVSSF